MDIFDHPVLLVVVLILSIISTILCWNGMRQKNVPALLAGIGISVPTFSIQDIRFWAVGGILCALAWWIRRYLENV